MYSSYTAASFARKHDLAARHGVNLEGVLTWAFQFEGQPLFAGFRALATGGLDLPVLNVFRMFGRMSGQRLAVESSGAVPLDAVLAEGVRGRPDVSALASLDKDRAFILAWHYHDDDVPGAPADVQIVLEGLPRARGKARLEHFRIDGSHSNSFAAWQRLGSPAQPTPAQYAQLEQAGRLASLHPPRAVDIAGARARMRFPLPRQAVSLVVLDWRGTGP
jgi:xylan 1,4-beta-xylosidase